MNGFNRSYMYRSKETKKKERKSKNYRDDACKCFPPFVKLHYPDCPVVMKPCPVHGNYSRHTERQEKVEREQNIVISFHPSTKTERLLQPIKGLLAHCNSETKINFQYYSRENTNSKEDLKVQNSQNTYENLKRSLNNNIFVEKTKSFVANNTNRVKKLKQCFHSPCNSIAQKTRSQISIKEKLNQILRDEVKQSRNIFYNMVHEIPPDDKYDPTPQWFSSRNGFKHHDFLSDENLDSDFITVTQQDRNNAIQHKIFEIKHRKGLNDTQFMGFPKPQNHFVYSTVNLTKATINDGSNQKHVSENTLPGSLNKTDKDIDISSSEKTNRSIASSSSSSVYITPFIFVPKGMEDSDTSLFSKLRKIDLVEEGIQVEGLDTPRANTPIAQSPKETQTSQEIVAGPVVPISPKVTPQHGTKCKSVVLQTDSLVIKSTVCHSSSHVYVHNYVTEPNSATGVEDIYVRNNERAVMTNNFDEDSLRQNKSYEISTIPESIGNRRTAEIPAGTSYKEVLTTTRGGRMKNKTSQTDNPWSVKTFDSPTHKSLASVGISEKGIQTVSTGSVSYVISDHSESTQFNSAEMTYIVKSFEQQESDRAIDKLAKTCWGKSHSDSDLLDRLKCSCCKVDNEYLQYKVSKNSEVDNSAGTKSTVTRVYDTAVGSVMENNAKAGNVTLKTKETFERFSDNKQTSTREEELSAAVSDLSELKKIIQEFFERGSSISNRTCGCDRIEPKGAVVDRETMTTDITPLSSTTEKRRNFVDRIVQTINYLDPLPYKRNNTLQEVQSTEEKVEKNVDVQTPKEKVEKKNVDVQTSGVKSLVVKKSTEVQTSLQVVKKTTEVQTSLHVVKNDTEAQTSLKVLLDEVEQEEANKKKVKVLRTFVVDPENQTKTFFVCSVCGREMKNLVNMATNTTEQVSDRPLSSGLDRPPKSELVDMEYTRSIEVQMRTKKVLSTDPSKTSKPKSEKVDRPEQREQSRNERKEVTERSAQRMVKHQEESPQSSTTQKSKLPVPNPPVLIRFKTNETMLQRQTDYFGPEQAREKITSQSHNAVISKTERNCICATVAGPSTSKGPQQGIAPDDATGSKAKGTKSPVKLAPSKRDDVQNNRRQSSSFSSKNHKTTMFPLLVTPFWPKQFLKTMKSMEKAMSDTLSSDDSKSQIIKQKRSYDKDLEVVAAGKKMKKDSKQTSKEYLPELGQLGDFKICPPDFVQQLPQTPDDERNSTAIYGHEAIKQFAQSHRENSQEISDDSLLDSEHFSDSNNTPGTTEYEDEEDVGFYGEAEVDETTVQEPGEQQFDVSMCLPQSSSAVLFNKSLFPDMITSKSLNQIWLFINPKKHKKSRRKHSK